MFHSLESQIAFVALMSATAFALLKGAAAERGGAVLIFLSWFAEYTISFAFKGVFSANTQELILLATDAALAVGLLVLALCFAKIWLGVAMLMLSAQLALHGAVMGDWGLPFRQYLVFNNLLSFGLIFLLGGASVAAWLQRKRKIDPSEPTSSASAFDLQGGQTAS